MSQADNRTIPSRYFDAVRRFLSDGCSSPLYGRSPVDALLAIGELERRVVLARLPHALGR